MQSITPELEALLKSKLQAGTDGFRARFELDRIVPGAPADTTDYLFSMVAFRGTSAPVVPTDWTLLDETGTGDRWVSVAYREPNADGSDPLSALWSGMAGSARPRVISAQFAGVTGPPEGESAITGTGAPTLVGPDVVASGSGYVLTAFCDGANGPADYGASFVFTSDDTIIAQGYAHGGYSPRSALVYRYVESAGTYSSSVTRSATPAHATDAYGAVGWFVPAVVDSLQQYVTATNLGGTVTFVWPDPVIIHAVDGPAGPDIVVTYPYDAIRAEIDKSLRLAADQAEATFANEDLPFGWGPSSIFPTNSRCRVYQWYGDPANEICTFTGLVDKVADSRDVLTTSVSMRSMIALLLDQTFSTIAPQTEEEKESSGSLVSVDRTAANGVYLSMEADAIVSDILDRAGWPTADRDITATSYVLDEYVIADGWSWAEAIIGEDRITGYTGYSLWDDELGVIHFGPSPQGSFTDPPDPVYTFRSGEDVTELQHETDQYDLITRVKVRGPLTTQVLSDTWREVWRTTKIAKPVGIWYDPAETDVIRVISRSTKRLYRMRRADRVIEASVYLGGSIPYPLGLSGDPADSTIYWVLNCPWIYTGSTSGNSVKKVRRSDHKVVASYALPNGRWSALKASSTHLWLTNLDTDKFYKRSKTATSVASYTHTYGSTLQTNPAGMMIDGTTLSVFWSNGGTTARFLQCDTSAPSTVTKVVKTAGTALHGGEMNTTTHTECWGDSDSLNLVAEFSLVEVTDQTNEVYAEVVDTDLEDELGMLAQMEGREHDTHTGDADHPYEVRRLTLDLTAITSLAQATQTAQRVLEERGKRRRVLDVGVLGQPAVQKTDVVAIVDPVTGTSESYAVDTYRTAMAETYIGTLALIPLEAYDDAPTDDGDAEEDEEIDVNPDPDETDPGPDD